MPRGVAGAVVSAGLTSTRSRDRLASATLNMCRCGQVVICRCGYVYLSTSARPVRPVLLAEVGRWWCRRGRV
jgi:hypothetical protein